MKAAAVRLSARVSGLIIALLAFIAPSLSAAAISPQPNKPRNLAVKEPQRTSGLRAHVEAKLRAIGARFPIPSGALR
jgi:hypothetical protein